MVASYKTDLVTKLFTAALLDIVNSIGVEWGFRAYLLPKLFRKIGAIPSMVLNGIIAGIWYAPFVVKGYYYGDGNLGFPIVNILAMCVFCCVTGIIYSYLSLRTGSIFPSIFAHSSLNVMMSQPALFTFDGGNYFVGPSPTGIISGIPFIIVAAICIYDVYKNPIQVTSIQTTTKTE
jgi:membrane protease YdiL (CAAX protease family)